MSRYEEGPEVSSKAQLSSSYTTKNEVEKGHPNFRELIIEGE